MNTSSAAHPTFTVYSDSFNDVHQFTYLGSILTSDCDLNNEIQQRVKLALAAFGRLSHRVFLNRCLAIATKIAVYKAICIFILDDPPVRMWVMDSILSPYQDSGGLSYTMSQKHPQHSSVAQGHSCWDPSQSLWHWLSWAPLTTKATPLSRPCNLYALQPTSSSHTRRRISQWAAVAWRP